MLRDEAMCEATTPMIGASDSVNAWGVDTQTGYDEWQDVDRELRSIARRQSGLDAELMRALREAERVRLWRHLGCISMMEYLERVFGYSPRVAQERLRTAHKLEQLPALAAALGEFELPFSAVRELSRIATPTTERAWRDAARGTSLREIEEMVSGRAEGDLPTSRKKPELETSRLSYERVVPATRARERQLRQLLDAERGERLDDGAFIAAVFELALGALTGAAAQGVADHAKYQIVVYHCKSCGAGTQVGAGVQFDLDEAALERAQCDAERVSGEAPGPVTQDIPKKVRRFVDLRDGKRCRIPGCRASACLELHHIEHLEDGGTHDPENIVSTCDGHHAAHHRGVLWISGTSSNLIVRRADEQADSRGAVGDSAEDDRATHDEAGREGTDLSRADRANGDGVERDEVRIADAPGAHVGTDLTTDLASSAPAVLRTDAREPRPRRESSRSRFEQAEQRTTACTALRSLGYKTAAAAVDAALDELGPELALEPLIRAALQRCRER